MLGRNGKKKEERRMWEGLGDDPDAGAKSVIQAGVELATDLGRLREQGVADLRRIRYR